MSFDYVFAYKMVWVLIHLRRERKNKNTAIFINIRFFSSNFSVSIFSPIHIIVLLVAASVC